MINAPSRLWLPAAVICLSVLIADVVVIAVKGRNAAQEPTIQDVFQGETHEFSADLGQLTSIVPPTDYVATPPENHGPQYRTADWLRAQGSLAWTLQVMAVEDEEIAKSYIANRADKEQFAYFMFRNGEKTQYIVVYGNYVTMELALGVANTTDLGMAADTRASPEKFVTYLPNVPLIQPAIDQPPPVKYGDVPVVPTEPDPSTEPANTTEVPPNPENGTNNASLDTRPEADPF